MNNFIKQNNIKKKKEDNFFKAISVREHTHFIFLFVYYMMNVRPDKIGHLDNYCLLLMIMH
jgi:hypothetical protein